MFVQIIEGHTTDAEGLKRQAERWRDELKPGAKGFHGLTAGVTAGGRAIMVARFVSEDAARANSRRPEQGQWWTETEKYYDDVEFTESTDVTRWLDGGSDDAGFVQVMKSAGVDRAGAERIDAQFEKLSSARPDVIGGYRAWTGRDTCIELAYFTSEAEARAGEKAVLPPELQQLMAEMGDSMGSTEYLDLTDPVLC